MREPGQSTTRKNHWDSNNKINIVDEETIYDTIEYYSGENSVVEVIRIDSNKYLAKFKYMNDARLFSSLIHKMQVETSSSYGGNVAMFATGGLNFQIEHHVFPRLSSWHYPRVSGAVKKCCERHGVKYNYFPYIWDNTLSTLRYMRKVGVLAVMQHAREEF